MAQSKKYSYQLEQIKGSWTAKIIRKASYKTFIVSKEQKGFKTELEAKEWSETTLAEFTLTQSSSNERHGKQRKMNEEERRQRSVRRSEKTQLEKQQANDSGESDLIIDGNDDGK